MHFEWRQEIAATLEEVERAMLDPDYLPFQLEHHPVLLEIQGLERKDLGDTIERRVRYRPKPVIKSIGPKEVPPEWFAFVESSTFDKRTHTLTFTNTATTQKISRMLVNTGTLRLREIAPGRVVRKMEGEISLKLPFFLKPLGMIGEQVIRSEGIKILEGEAPVLQRYIEEVLRA